MPTIELSDTLYNILKANADAANLSAEAHIEQLITSTAPAAPTQDVPVAGLQRIADTLPYILYVQDLTAQKIIYVNAYFESYFDIDKATIYNGSEQFVLTLLHPDDLHHLDNFEDELAQLTDDDVSQREVRMRNSEGRYHWFKVIERVFKRDQTGSPTQILGTAIDIHEQKTIEAVHHQKEKLYRALFANLPNGAVLIYDKDLRYVVADGMELEAAGYIKSEVEGELIQDMVSAEFYNTIKPHLEAALQGTAHDFVLPAENDKYYHVFFLPLRLEADPLDYAMVAINDVSALKQSESQYRETVERLELAIQTANIGMWHLNLKTNQLIWNRQLYDIYGLTPADLQKDPDRWRDMVHPDDKAYVNAELEKLADNLVVYDINFRIVRPDGGIRYLNASHVQSLDEHGNLTRLVGVNLDVTNIVQSQRKLHESEAHYKALFNGVQNSITVFDKDVRILMINEAGAKLMGQTPQDLEGVSLKELLPHAYDSAKQLIDNVLATQESQQYESSAEYDGDTRYYWSSAQPIFEADGTVRKVQIISYDITERIIADKLADERKDLEQSLEYERELSEQRHRMMSVLSHEIRTPLTIVMNSAEILTRYKDRLPEERKEQRLLAIEKHIIEVTNLLDEMSSHSKLDHAILNFRPVKTDVAALCTEVIKACKSRRSDKHQVDVSLSEPNLQATLDAHLMKQALSNLLANALQYSQDGGRVTLAVSIDENDLCFAVTDNGMGIAEPDMEDLFTPFTRGENVGSIRGTGIGLSIVKQIVTLHHGEIDVQSKLNEGSTFTIKLPLT